MVLGGGFGGMSAVRALRDVDADVLLLDRDLYNTFQPLLYQVATGGLSSSDVTYALRSFASRSRNARYQQADVIGIDPEAKTLEVDGADDVGYDYLIIACGVGANFFGIPGAAENAKPIYTRDAAVKVRDTTLWNLEAIAQGRDGAAEPTVVVVGGGATGVETAGALADLRNAILEVVYPELESERVKVILVEMADHVLGPFDPGLREYAAAELRERGVDLRLGTAVEEVREDCVLLSDGSRIAAATTIWASGVKVEERIGDWGLAQRDDGRIEVGADLRVAGHSRIFAIGDVAGTPEGGLPQLAQPAIQGGQHAARQIGKLLAGVATKEFTYHDKGTMATIGRSDAVVELPNGIKFKGLIAWIAWMALHVFMLMSNRNRLATMANLSVRYFTWRKTTNFIVGDPP